MGLNTGDKGDIEQIDRFFIGNRNGRVRPLGVSQAKSW
jgi:hypothetical protein